MTGRASFVREFLALFTPHLSRGVEVSAYLLLKLASDVVVPWSTKVLIDEVIPGRELHRLALWSTVVLVAFVVGSLATYRWSVVSGALAVRVLAELRVRCLEKLHALSVRFHTSTTSGDLLALLTQDIDRLQGVAERVLPALFFETASLIVILVVAVKLNAWLAFSVIGLGAPLFSALYFATNRRLGLASRSLQDEEAKLMGVAAEELRNHLVIKLFGLEVWASRTFSASLDRAQARALSVVRLSALLSGATNFVFHGVRFAVLAAGALLVVKGRMSTGSVVAFFTLVGGLIAPFVTIAEQLGELQVGAGAFERVSNLLGVTDTIRAGSAVLSPLQRELRVDDLTVRHERANALTRASLVIPAGALVALVGASGSGKSTLLGALARLFEPDSGRITFDGIELGAASVSSLRREIAFVPQSPHLFNLTVAENVRLGRLSATRAEVERALAEAGLAQPNELGASGFDTLAGEQGNLLSGGQAQRVAVARALVTEASVLLLDEPTAALDAAAETALVGVLERLRNEGRTVVFATHRLSAAERADIVVTLQRGEVISVAPARAKCLSYH
jgi:ABC-type multidrug transport system fused ATPase/permease subunit